jgi:hypothetical protein
MPNINIILKKQKKLQKTLAFFINVCYHIKARLETHNISAIIWTIGGAENGEV